MSITTEQAKVYRGGGRRWLTVKAAARAEGRTLLRKFCECEKGDYETPDYVCKLHHDQARYHKLLSKLTARYIRAFLARNEPTTGGAHD